MKALLNLFNAIQVIDKKEGGNLRLNQTIKNGFILSPNAAAYSTTVTINEITKYIGISGEKANASFHKSWKTIKDTPQEALWAQAIIHYMTTYGFEELGIYNEASVYIPHEKLEIPEIKEDIKLIVINGLTREEILVKIIKLGGSGIALKQETIDDIMEVVEFNEYSYTIIKDIKNKELKSRLQEYYNIIPTNPLEFLRYTVTKLTEESLLIKNDYLISKIKDCNSTLHRRTLDNLLEQAPDNLAEIFFRFKPIFLALKSISKNKTFFNKLRKKANKLHKPMKSDLLNDFTAILKRGELIDIKEFKEALDKVNIFRKIRLAYALKYRTLDVNSIMYKVRNGKAYTKEFKNDLNKVEIKRSLDMTIESIANDLKEKLEGKIIYIPKNIGYTLPATEKQFVGNFPVGSYISIEEDMVFGIHWTNTSQRVDLDLSMIDVNGKIGWDSSYKSSESNVMFSGDITNAPKPEGATELFYVNQGKVNSAVVHINFYNHSEGDKCPTKIIVGSEKCKNFGEGRDYMIDQNNIITEANIDIDKKNNVIGFVTTVGDENRFYFTQSNVGRQITASNNERSEMMREYFLNNLVHGIELKNVLIKAGATIIDEIPVEGEYIDLSPKNLDKTTFIDLLVK